MDDKSELLRHFLAALAYRTQKAVRDAPHSFYSFRAAPKIRTPLELVRHMESVLGYARTFFIGGQYDQEPLPDFQAEILRFHKTVEGLGHHLESGTPLIGITPEQLLQGPFSDAMTHAGRSRQASDLESNQRQTANKDFKVLSYIPEYKELIFLNGGTWAVE
jgi:hypothetical protein